MGELNGNEKKNNKKESSIFTDLINSTYST